MKNTLEDLHNYLFEQIERLNDEELSQEELDKEIKRAGAISKVSSQIVRNASVMLDAKKVNLEYGYAASPDILVDRDRKKAAIEDRRE